MKTLPLFLALSSTLVFAQTRPVTTLQVPGAGQPCRIDPAGVSVLPSGRFVTPAGQTVRITRGAFGLKLSPDGRKAVVLHNGVVTVLDAQNPENALRLPSYDETVPAVVKDASFLGVAIAPDSRTAYLSGGDKGTVVRLDLETGRKTGEIRLDTLGFGDSFTSDLTLDAAGTELFVLDRANFRLVRIDLKTERVTASVRVGRIPFGIALSPDGRYAFVANVGQYAYPLVPGVTPQNGDSLMLRFPPYGVPSREAEGGVTVDGRKIPGLGKPNAPEAMSVWTVDLTTNQVVDRFKTGYQVGEFIEGAEIVGGSSPNSIAVGSRYAFVSNATNDLISVIDWKAHRLLADIKLKIHPKLDRYRGLFPFGLTLSRDEKTLYVALLGFNAVAVVDVPTRRRSVGTVRGLIPTGWGTTRVVLSADEKTLYVTSARGYGAGPNGGRGFVKPPQGTYIGDIQLSTFQKIPVPDAPTLARYTKQTLENTFRDVVVKDDGKNPLPPAPGLRQSPIKHIVYVTKENRTYDEVFGQLSGGDSTLARFGLGVTVTGKGADTLRAADVMPNHRRIAQQFAYSDNFYCDSDASIHGHHWMVGTIPNEYVEANSATSGRFDPFSKAPGRRFPKATGAMDPEDYNEIGGLWEALARKGVSFYNFGEANEYAGVAEEQFHTEFGARQPVVFPMPKVLFDRTSREYAGYNTNIPDQYRMEQFEREFTEKWIRGKEKLPQLLAMQLPNDHGAGARAKDGYPYLHSYMADNDLAVGRLLHFLSRTKYWKNMLVVITEDDPQGGVDHVDAHRSVLLLAGPYVKRGHVSHTHANFGSILKLIYNLLNVPYVNQYDVTASLLQDFFTEKPDFRPYDAVLPDHRVFDPQRAMEPYKKTFDWRKIEKGPEMDDEADQRREHYRQQN